MVDFDRREILKELADKFANQLEEGELTCPSEGCESDLFDVEMWVSSGGGLEGAAVCRECNKRFELNPEDSGVKQGLDEIERELKKLERMF